MDGYSFFFSYSFPLFFILLSPFPPSSSFSYVYFFLSFSSSPSFSFIYSSSFFSSSLFKFLLLSYPIFPLLHPPYLIFLSLLTILFFLFLFILFSYPIFPPFPLSLAFSSLLSSSHSIYNFSLWRYSYVSLSSLTSILSLYLAFSYLLTSLISLSSLLLRLLLFSYFFSLPA